MKPPVVLLTDFGWAGPYVGQMKGVLAGLAPGIPVIDLSHDVSPQDVREGAFLLEASWRFFPEGSVFVAVVDPGVGTDRAPMAVSAVDRFFVGPDNGLLPGALPPGAALNAVRLENPAHRWEEVSATFHGRDLFAPAGAALARGVPLPELGPAMGRLIDLPDRFSTVAPSSIEGTIVHIDRFGNAVSDISRDRLDEWRGETATERLHVHVGDRVIRGIRRTYGESEPGEVMALFGSMGYLEVAVRNGSAAGELGLNRRDKMRVREERE